MQLKWALIRQRINQTHLVDAAIQQAIMTKSPEEKEAVWKRSEILAVPSPYRGGAASYATVQAELLKRYGPKIAEDYRPELCRSYHQWRKICYAPIPGTQGIKVVTIVEERNEKNEVERKFPKVVTLFNINMVRRIKQ